MITPPPFNEGLFSKMQGIIAASAWRKWFTDLSNYILTATGVASVSATSPVQSTGGNTPVISIPAATDSVAGYLTASDHILISSVTGKVTANTAITPGTKTKITYDSKGLVTSGAAATTADIADSTDKRYCTDAQKVVIGNTSNTNTGDQTLVGLGGVPTTLTVNGKALSANITLGLASADYANQGSTTTVLHGNAAGNPAFGAVVEADITLANNTTNNVSITKHGFCPIAPNSLTQFLRGDGGWGTPAGTGMSAPTGTGYVHITGGAEDAAAATGYLFTGKQILTSASGTYTPTAGTTAILVEVQGGGGGGGGVPATPGSTAAAAAGGGGGGYSKLWITSLAGSYTYAVGASASGGTNGSAGTAGNASTFGPGPLITANGGGAAAGCAAQGTSLPQAVSQGGAGGVGSGGDINIQGGGGGWGLIFSTIAAAGAAISGQGGCSFLGLPAIASSNNTNGNNGTGYGSGGGGAVSVSGGAIKTGGSGAAGLIIVWEYK
jgi:hypothetical protein